MSEFSTFVDLGFHHIVDPRAFDHLLFIITLCAVYQVQEWRKILILITAFTIGHSATLVLSGLQVLSVPSDLVELLIPLSIVATSIYNVAAKGETAHFTTFAKSVRWNYAIALLFGLIHGMGFANYFRSLMGEGGGFVWPLFSFNVGIEVGQLLIVACFFGLHYLLHRILGFKHRSWNQYVSGIGGGGAMVLIMQNLFA
jgi:hypothetical protein